MRAKLTICMGLVLALAFSVGYAQDTTSGTLEGTVVEKGNGAPIADAIVTAQGPQGIRTATTNNQGRYVIRGLVAASYTVVAEAAGYNKVSQTDVRVSINTRTQLVFELAKGVTENITVTSEAPLVDLKSTSTGANVTIDDFAPYVPLGRNLVSVFSIAPGVNDGGTLGQTNSSISGSSGLENAYFVDGVNITNSGYGALGAYSIVYGSLGTGVTYDFLEEVQVKTGGFEAEFGQAGGGVVNSVVRSGSNDFALDFSWFEEPASLEGSRNDRLDAPNWGNIVETERRDIALSIGGPILKDKLFYFAAYNPITQDDTFKLTSGSSTTAYDLDGDGTADDFFPVGSTISGGQVPSEIERTRENDNYAGKISWFITPNHKIDATAFGDPSEGDVGPQNATTFLRNLAAGADPSTGATGLDYGGDQYSAKYQGVWTPNFFTTLQFAHKENNFDEFGPGVDFVSILNAATNNTTGGAGFYESLSDETDQWKLKNTHIFGPVELSYGAEFEDIDWAQPRAYSGPAYTEYFPNLVAGTSGGFGFAQSCADPTVLTDTACYTPVQSATGASLTLLGSGLYQVTRTEFVPESDVTTAEERNYFAQATWEVTPTVTIKAGARYTEQELTGSGNVTLPIGTGPGGLPVGGVSTDLNAQSYEFDGEVAPRLGVTWDVQNNGKHKLYANYAEYYQRVPSDLAVRAFSNEVGTTDSEFVDSALTMPALSSTCIRDADGDGVFGSAGDTTSSCHVVQSVQGLAGGGSIILDGSQLTPGSDVNTFLGSNAALTSSGRTGLPYTEEYLAGYAWQFNDYSNIELRYIHREIGRALEDVQFTSNEQTWNLFWGADGGVDCGTTAPFPAGCSFGNPFPGAGSGAFGAYVFANVGENVNTNLFPVPVRDYDALEFIYNRRFNNNWLAYVNYRYAELEGNYEGSFRNDNGQSDPFLTSLFDFPQASAVDSNNDGTFDTFLPSQTLAGQFTNGPLNTDRRHILNAFVSRQFDFGLNLGGRMTVRSGQPQGPLFAHPAYQNAGEIPGFNPVYWWGVNADVDGDGTADGVGFFTSSDGTLSAPPSNPGIDFNGDGTDDSIIGGFVTGPRLFSYDVVERDFFGRTSTLITFDFSASYDFALRNDQSKLTLQLDVFNLFDDNGPIAFDNNVETRPGVANIDFLKANQYQAPRNVRLGVKFSW